MSPLHQRPNGVDKIIRDSVELRAQLLRTVEGLESFIAKFSEAIEQDEGTAEDEAHGQQ